MSRRTRMLLGVATIALAAVLWRATTVSDQLAHTADAVEGLGSQQESQPMTDENALAATASTESQRSNSIPETDGQTVVTSSPGARFQVVDGISGVGIAELAIAVKRSGTPDRSLVTDSQGLFEVASPETCSELVIDVPSYFPLSLGPDEIERLPGTRELRRIELWGRGTLSVRVLRKDRTPIAGAYIQIYPADTRTRRRLPRLPRIWPQFIRSGRDRAVTDSKGEFTAPLLPCGTGVAVTASGIVSDTVAYFEIPAMTCAGEGEIVASDSSTVHGAIRFEDGEPAVDINVQLYPRERGANFPRKARTDRRGEFRFVGVPMGWNGWAIVLPSERPRMLEVTASDVDLGVVTVARPALVSGHVRLGDRPEQLSLSPLSVRAIQNGLETATYDLESDGAFELLVLPGRVDLDVSSMAGDLVRTTVIAPASDIEISLDSQMARLRFHIVADPPPQRVEVLLVDRGQPSKGSAAQMLFGQSTEPDWVLQAEPNGHWSMFFIPPSTYDVTVVASGVGAFFRENVALPASTAVDLGALSLGSGSIHGMIVDAEDVPIAGQRITATFNVPDDVSLGPKDISVTSGESGSFDFNALESGPWVIRPESSSLKGDLAHLVVVLPGSMQSVRLRAHRAVSLRGRVTSKEIAIGAATIRVTPIEDVSIRWGTREALSDTNGEFEFADITPGEYLVKAAVRSGEWDSRVVTVRPEGDTRVDFEADDGRSLITFLHGAEPVFDVSSAMAFFPSGHVDVRLNGDDGAGTSARLGEGPWVFLLRPIAANVPVPGAPVATYYALVDCAGCKAPPALTAELGSGEVRVTLREGAIGWQLPDAKFVDFAGFRPYIGVGKFCTVYHEDRALNERQFKFIPVRSRVRILGTTPVGSRIDTEFVHDGRSTVELLWPPDHY